MNPTNEAKIMRLFERDNRDYTAYEIAYSAKISKNSVYSTLTRMIRKGLVRRVERGIYRANPTIGVGDISEPMRIQNIRLVSRKMDGKSIEPPSWLDYKPFVGYVHELELLGLGRTEEDKVRLRFQIGSKRAKLTFTVKAPLGLDLYGFQFALQWLYDRLDQYGFSGDVHWIVDRGTEMFKDYPNVDLDALGSKAITLGEFNGWVEKIYQKAYGMRRELKLDHQTSLDAIMAVTMGGFSAGQVLNMNALAIREMEKSNRALKSWSVGASETQRALQDMMPPFMNAIYKIIDKIDDISRRMTRLEDKLD
ncbi:MAG: helix-turn-helix domain-containing protein [Candidatus Thorarchaeota archaeon]